MKIFLISIVLFRYNDFKYKFFVFSWKVLWFLKKIFLVIGVFLIVVIVIGIVFLNIIFFIKKKIDEDIIKREIDDGYDVFEFFEWMKKIVFVILFVYGYDIKGYYVVLYDILNIIIICYGVMMNVLNFFKYMYLFFDFGWNVIVYDYCWYG